MQQPEKLFGEEFATKFKSAGVREMTEAAMCRAYGRTTAAVFHLMRCMEIGVRTVAKCLGIPDPVTGSGRNWGSMLQKIKAEMNAKDQARRWQPGDREKFEAAYGSLDAVRAAWRNTTMHIENNYDANEAEHIFLAVREFMRTLASRTDEEGQPLA